MRVNRLELIEKLKGMVAERETSAEARKAEAYDKAANAERVYLDEHAGDWSTFATKIRARIRQGKAVTLNDVPEGLRKGSRSWPEVRVFSPVTVKDSEYLPHTEPLIRLIAVLESSPDELISTSALDRIGAPLKELMRP